MNEDNQLANLNGKPLEVFYPIDKARINTGLETAKQNMELVRDTKAMLWFKNTDFMTDAFVMNKRDDLKNIVTLCKNLNDRQDALLTNKFHIEDRMLEADELEEEASLPENENRPAKRKRLKEKAKNMRDESVKAYAPLMSCIDEFNHACERFKTLKEKIVKEHGEFSQKVMDKMEQKYWIKELLHQAMYDIRYNNKIGIGAQRNLECIGLDPVWVELNLRELYTRQVMNYKTDMKEQAKDPKNYEPKFNITTASLDSTIDKMSRDLEGIFDAKMIRNKMIDVKQKSELLKEAAV